MVNEDELYRDGEDEDMEDVNPGLQSWDLDDDEDADKLDVELLWCPDCGQPEDECACPDD